MGSRKRKVGPENVVRGLKRDLGGERRRKQRENEAVMRLEGS